MAIKIVKDIFDTPKFINIIIFTLTISSKTNEKTFDLLLYTFNHCISL